MGFKCSTANPAIFPKYVMYVYTIWFVCFPNENGIGIKSISKVRKMKNCSSDFSAAACFYDRFKNLDSL